MKPWKEPTALTKQTNAWLEACALKGVCPHVSRETLNQPKKPASEFVGLVQRTVKRWRRAARKKRMKLRKLRGWR